MLRPRARPPAAPGPRAGTHTEGRGRAARERRGGSGHRCRRRYRARPCCRQDRQLLPHFRFPGQSRSAAPPSRSGPALRAAPRRLMTSRGRSLARPGPGPGKTSRVPAAPPRPRPAAQEHAREPGPGGFQSKISECLLFRLRRRKTKKTKRAGCRHIAASPFTLLHSFYRLRKV